MSGITNSIKNKIYHTFVDELVIKETVTIWNDSLSGENGSRWDSRKFYRNGIYENNLYYEANDEIEEDELPIVEAEFPQVIRGFAHLNYSTVTRTRTTEYEPTYHFPFNLLPMERQTPAFEAAAKAANLFVKVGIAAICAYAVLSRV